MSELNGHAENPLVMALQSWKDAGVLDAPERIASLAKAFEHLEAVVERQSEVIGRLEKSLANANDAVERLSARSPTVTLSLPDSMRLDIPPAQVTMNPLIEVAQPVNNNEIRIDVDSMAKTLAYELTPILKGLANRPVSEVHHVDNGAPLLALHKSLGELVERLNQPAPPAQVTVDMTLVAKALSKHGKATNAAIEKTLATVEKLLTQKPQGADANLGALIEGAVRKVVGELPESQRRTVVKKIQPEYDGSFTISEIEADESQP